MDRSIRERTALLKAGKIAEFHAYQDQGESVFDRLADVEARVEAQDAVLNALKTGIAAAFEGAGKQAPAEIAPEQVRPQLRVIQGGAGAA